MLAQWVGLCTCGSSVAECYPFSPHTPGSLVCYLCRCLVTFLGEWGRKGLPASLQVSYQNPPKFLACTHEENTAQGPELRLFLEHLDGVPCFSKCPSQDLEFEMSSFWTQHRA